MSASSAFFVTMVAIFTSVCLVTDLRWRRIPNWLTVPGFAIGVLAHTVRGGLAGLQFSLLGFAAGFVVLLVLWLIGGGGAGDVKMMGALGAWLGPRMTFEVFVGSAIVTLLMMGGLMCHAALSQSFSAARRRYTGRAIREANEARSRGEKGRSRPGRILPYAVPVAVSTWIVLAVTWIGGSLFENIF